MTFVAQPFEQFADDLLTALTGGVIREEHEFLGAEETYSLASSPPQANTIVVFGQRNNAFAIFERGIDYEYQEEANGVVFASDGRVPDTRSFFYVNYYLENAVSKLTDRNPGSVIS